ncbi:DUF2202 domain-containing protein [Desulfosarcina sp.]|nr:DUF2202 domain-containing protein [Desulfosarcina sp.]
MKTIKFYALIGAVLGAMLCVSCSKDDDEDVTPVPTTTLSDAEKSGLLEMIEIEKLHRDIYQTMSENNQCELFGELCNCDGDFMNLLSAKVDKYKLINPIKEGINGVYDNDELQVIYNEFMKISDEQLKQLLYFAKELEEHALLNVDVFIANTQSKDDIRDIYLDIKKQSNCQLENIIDRIENQIPVEHPGNPGDEN